MALFLVLLSAFSIFASNWSYIGLGSTVVTNLVIRNDTLYASTYNGLYKKAINSNDTTWQQCGMAGKHVVQTLIPDNNTFICVVEIDNSQTTMIYKSTNDGKTFSLMDTSIGIWNPYQYLDVVAHPDNNYDTLYFVNHQIKTFDGGKTWSKLNFEEVRVARFIKINPIKHNQLIIGGETSIFNAIISTSTDYGDNWTFPNMLNYFPGDNSVHDIEFDGDSWYAVGEGIINKTIDGGNTWETLLSTWEFPPKWDLYWCALEFSPSSKSIMYASGQNVGAHDVVLLHTNNSGLLWDTLSYTPTNFPADSSSKVSCIAIKTVENIDNVFLGGQGVYLYKQKITTSVEKKVNSNNNLSMSINISPSVFNPSTKINCRTPSNSVLKIVTITGSIIKEWDLQQGDTSVVWNGLDKRNRPISAGLYIAILSSPSGSIEKKMSFIK